MEIDSRGIPPYLISSRSENDQHAGITGKEQFSSGQTFKDAFLVIFDLTNGGKFLRGQYIKDDLSDIVFSVENPKDLELLYNADRAGVTKVIFT